MIHWPSVRGRARADAGPLLLVAVVVAVVCLLAGAVPPLLRHTADNAVRDAVGRAGDEAVVQAGASWEDDWGPTGGHQRDPDLAAELSDFRGVADQQLDPSLRAVLEPPVTTVEGPSLMVTDGSVQRHFEIDYVQDANGPAVTWISGGPAKAAKVDPHIEIPADGPPWPVQVGISEEEAADLKLKVGDHVKVEDAQRNPKNVVVSGIYRATDPNSPAWKQVPWLLHPVAGVDGAGATRLGGLLSDQSLPDARLAYDADLLPRTVWFTPDPSKITWESAQALALKMATLKAASSYGGRPDLPQWDTQLDQVLRDVHAQIDAATAQASVLLIAVLVAAVLVLLLAADLLVRRRALALTAARQRGAALPWLTTELLVESVTLTVAAAALGLALSFALAGGAALNWAAPVMVAAILAAPVLGTLVAARATRDRRAPANRSARRWQQRTGQLRRASLELAIVAATAGAIVSLRQRGIGAGGALPAGAPTLGVVTGALVLLRLLPAGTHLALRRALRSRRPLAVFGAARAAATSARALPLLVLVTGTALASFAVTVVSTTNQGLADGAWRTVGADARLDVTSDADASTAGIARKIAAAPGVSLTVTGRVTDTARVIASNTSFTPELVVVDPAAFRHLLRSTPLPDAPDLAKLSGTGTGTGTGSGIQALVRSADGGLHPGMNLQLYRDNGSPVTLTAVGTAPAVDGASDVVLVNAAALPSTPNTVWALGAGAGAAVNANTLSAAATVRAGLLQQRRTAPLTSGLVRLTWAAALTLIALGLLGFVLGAAASAPQRWETLARLRTLGLRPSDARRIATAELLPPVLVAAVCGPLLGLLLAKVTLGPLGLRILTGQDIDPRLVVPWWALAVIVVLLLGAIAVVSPAEAAVRRRQRLADVLRVGAPT